MTDFSRFLMIGEVPKDRERGRKVQLRASRFEMKEGKLYKTVIWWAIAEMRQQLGSRVNYDRGS